MASRRRFRAIGRVGVIRCRCRLRRCPWCIGCFGRDRLVGLEDDRTCVLRGERALALVVLGYWDLLGRARAQSLLPLWVIRVLVRILDECE